MTRKRFVKLMMADGISRNAANCIARCIQAADAVMGTRALIPGCLVTNVVIDKQGGRVFVTAKPK